MVGIISSTGGEDVQLSRFSDGRRAILHTQFAVDIAAVPLHRGQREHQPLGDFTVRKPFGDQLHHLQLPFTQRLDQGLGVASGG